jgi:hypothetical protein
MKLFDHHGERGEQRERVPQQCRLWPAQTSSPIPARNEKRPKGNKRGALVQVCAAMFAATPS